MTPPRLSPATQLSIMRTPGAIPVRGDVVITLGVAAQSVVVEAFDLEGIPQRRHEIAVAYYDQDEVDRFAAAWRALMARRSGRQAPKLGLLP